MSQTQCNKRRRRQAKMGNAHLAKIGRRVYKHKSVESAIRRLRNIIEGERMRQLRKGQSKKK